jgi:hypothetical protein
LMSIRCGWFANERKRRELSMGHTEREIAKSNGDLSTTSQRGGAGMVVGPVPLGQ